MTYCGGRGRAKIWRSLDRVPLAGATEVVGDEWIWLFSIIDTELAGATIKFTAKYCLEDPDASAPIAVAGDAAVTADAKLQDAIVIYPSSNAGRIDGVISISPTKSAAIDVMEGKASLWFDLQITRTTYANSPQVQTYFRTENAKFSVIKDVTSG